jgi:hypothetical protein
MQLLSSAQALEIKGAFDEIDTGSFDYDDQPSYGGYSYIGAGDFTPQTYGNYYAPNSIQPSWHFPESVYIQSNGIQLSNGSIMPSIDLPMKTTYDGQSNEMMVKMSYNLQGEGYYVTPGTYGLSDGYQANITNAAFQTKAYVNTILASSVEGNSPQAPAFLPSEERKRGRNFRKVFLPNV